MIDEYMSFIKANGYFDIHRNEQNKYWMYETINEHLRNSFYEDPSISDLLKKREEDVLNGKLTSFAAAHNLLDTYFDKLKKCD